jgi:hypothetical protein
LKSLTSEATSKLSLLAGRLGLIWRVDFVPEIVL